MSQPQVSHTRPRGPNARPGQLQLLMQRFQVALDTLHIDVPISKLERWSLLIHGCMTSQARHFHDVDHVLDISSDLGPIQTLAALFHDVVYYQVDGGFLPMQLKILGDAIHIEGDEVFLVEFETGSDPILEMTTAIFGFQPGQNLSPFGGLNEFLSALLALRCLADHLTMAQLLQVGTCIEATVPFRKTDKDGAPCQRLFTRLLKVNQSFELGLSTQELVKAVQSAQELANRDVGNFGTTDRAWFLDNTWRLLPESNSPLRQAGFYMVSEYQGALQKMTGFFSTLEADVIFGSFMDKPEPEGVARMTRRARRNIEVGRQYLRAKLVTMSMLAAIAERTGGDAPVGLFMGDLPGKGHRSERLEDFLPSPKIEAPVDPEVFELLAEGRKSESDFDLRNSPLSAYLYGILGDEGLDALMTYSMQPINEERADAILAAIPEQARVDILESCAQLALTRAEALRDLA